MVVFLHVAVALLSIGVATVGFFRPTKILFTVAYSLIGGTLLSGIYLAWSNPAVVLHVCVTGLIYTVVVVAITSLARVRFTALQKGTSRS